MRKNYYTVVAVLLACMVLPRVAAASVVYTYTGNPYNRFETEGVSPLNPYDLSMSVSAYFVLDEAVGPNRPVGPGYFSMYDWSISDGTITLDSGNTTSIAFSLGTDASGAITSWYFFATSDPLVGFGENYHQIYSDFGGGPFPQNLDLGNTANCIEFSSTSGACSNNNRITAFADTPGTWSVSPVPLPGAAWLFGTVLLALGAWRRGRTA